MQLKWKNKLPPTSSYPDSSKNVKMIVLKQHENIKTKRQTSNYDKAGSTLAMHSPNPTLTPFFSAWPRIITESPS